MIRKNIIRLSMQYSFIINIFQNIIIYIFSISLIMRFLDFLWTRFIFLLDGGSSWVHWFIGVLAVSIVCSGYPSRLEWLLSSSPAALVLRRFQMSYVFLFARIPNVVHACNVVRIAECILMRRESSPDLT